MAKQVNDSYKEIKYANSQLAKLGEMKSNLIDTVSHEFRTPLTCIKGHTSRLLRTDITLDDETKTKSLKVIKQQTERLSRLVEDLLVIPDIESRLLRIFPEELYLKEIFETCILSIEEKQMRRINLTIEENLPTVWADRDRLEQIILNLLDNAIKYSQEDSEINIKAIRQKDNALISIQNNCEPIPDKCINSLFNKFSRIDDKLTRTTRGTGLGLFITKGLIKSMNGKVWISNKNGFEINFILPLKEIDNNG